MSHHSYGKMCVFGCFDDSEFYSRNRTLINALAVDCSKVVEVRPRSSSGMGRSNHERLSSFKRLAVTAVGIVRDFLSLASQRGSLKGAGFYYIPYPAYMDFIFLRLLTWGTRERVVVVDAFLCLHDTLVSDRKMLAEKGIAARLVSWLERQTLRRADMVFIDTAQQKEMLVQQYDLVEDRVVVIPVGIDESVWNPAPTLPLKEEFVVLFWGTFIPLHGVDTIIEAAHILQASHPQIRFVLIGDGQTADDISLKIEKMAVTNVNWHRSLMPASELRRTLDASHCVLGIFGESDKAGNVIPYKAHQALACNKILISRSGPAFTELLKGQVEAGLFLIPAADSAALAGSILAVYESYSEICSEMNNRELYDRKLGSTVIRKHLASALETL